VERLGEVGWFIFNGCGKGDELGTWTYAGGRGESVIDYVLGDGEAWERVERLEVKNRIESNHFPIEVSLKGEVEGGVKRVSKGGRRWKWTEERIVKFKGRMEDWWEEKGDGKEIKWEVVKEGVRNILEEEQGKEGGWKKGWWDQECREEKRRVRRELEKMVKTGGRGREV